MFFFKTFHKVLEVAKDLDGKPFHSQTTFEQVWTFSEMKKSLSKRGCLPDSAKRALRLHGVRWGAEVDSSRPQFLWVSSYFEEPMIVEVRMISRKEYEAHVRRERENNIAAWEEYGERKWGC